MTFIDAAAMINQYYGIHPCGARFSKCCDMPMLPPGYPGDYWDCTGFINSVPSSRADYLKMWPRERLTSKKKRI